MDTINETVASLEEIVSNFEGLRKSNAASFFSHPGKSDRNGAIAENIDKRVSGTVTANIDKRVVTVGDAPAVIASVRSDTWGRTWGCSWGRTWFTGVPAREATVASPAINVTARVEGQVSGSHTKRVNF